MARSDSLKAQHQALVAIVGQISSLLDATKLQKDASGIASQLTSLTGKLVVHLAMEDESLYPQLKASKDPKASATAARFMAEMGGVKEAYESYAKKWNRAAIEKDPTSFIKETGGIASALAARIKKEETELYPLWDSMTL